MVQVIKLGVKRPVTRPLLPDPAPRPIRYTIISADDHIMEPPHAFEGRLPRKLQDEAPHVVETEDGHQVWVLEGTPYFQSGFQAVAGRPWEDRRMEPARYEDIRPGCYLIEDRIRDMDLNGVWASLNFPSGATGFGGTIFSETKDPELGLACVRAWNDWLFEEWVSAHPDRIIPLGLTYLRDPEKGAEEIRRNAKRGFKAVTVPEQPHRVGLPPVFNAWWEPIVRACAETETVLSLHVGSAGFPNLPPEAPILELGSTMFQAEAFTTCAQWLWSAWPARYPDLKITLSEGGIGWVASLIDRLENLTNRSGYASGWPDPKTRPAEVLKRNFWFTMIDDPSTVSTRHAIGIDHILAESDYPHGDGTWPDTQPVMEKLLAGVPDDDAWKITHENAAKLYRHPLPKPGSPHAAGLRR
ncbi:MAG: amidohydrolase family protein [Myxococcota bacterium]